MQWLKNCSPFELGSTVEEGKTISGAGISKAQGMCLIGPAQDEAEKRCLDGVIPQLEQGSKSPGTSRICFPEVLPGG